MVVTLANYDVSLSFIDKMCKDLIQLLAFCLGDSGASSIEALA